MKSIYFGAIIIAFSASVQAQYQHDPRQECVRDHAGYDMWSDGCNDCACRKDGSVWCSEKYCQDIVDNPLFRCTAYDVGRTWTYKKMPCQCTQKGGVVCQHVITTQ
ncbi:hypothetical protein H4219_006009 [Mycoemilia scoparia]|uniref:Pacifastin domain-containing protein n=1 Tax=Mycoemilia scoparia TaxID=417184 RepID=A0A9W7ZV19_9FUNG|nr:hypothetical protein H4219_006009 [Mycoemilia scoparia]